MALGAMDTLRIRVSSSRVIVRPPEPGWAAPVQYPGWLAARLDEPAASAAGATDDAADDDEAAPAGTLQLAIDVSEGGDAPAAPATKPGAAA